MEHTDTAAWGCPFEFQLSATNWTADEGSGWAAPAAGHPLDIFGSSCSLQEAYVARASYYAAEGSSPSGGEQQPVEKVTLHDDLLFEEQTKKYMNNPKKLFQKRNEEFKADAQLMKMKMHRYPPSIRDLKDDGLYTVPKVVAIGPYHHYRGDHLKKAEKVKYVAAHHCIERSGLDVQELYHEVVSATEKINARGLYDDEDVMMAGMGYEDDFLPMMFYDACFLVMYMLKKSRTKCEPELSDFFESNDDDIAHDIMLLENQIPWPVVEAVMIKCSLEPSATMKTFIRHCKDGCLQDRVVSGSPRVDWDEFYKAPHLLGLLRFYVVGKSNRCRTRKLSDSDVDKLESVPISTGAIELAEMGIFLTASETRDEIPAAMGIDRKWIIFGKLSVARLCLNDLHATMLLNMAALELCVTPDFFAAKREDSAVCSYLLLLCMLMHREEDVHELRRKGILQGAGRTNKQTLDFFTSLQSLRRGRCYVDVMIETEGYRMKRWGWWLWLYKFVYHNGKFIAGIISVVGTLVAILGTLMKIKGAR